MKKGRNPFTGPLAKEGISPEKAMAAWEIYDRKGTKKEPYTKERKKRGLGKELDLPTAEVNRLWDLMVKALDG